MNNFLFQINKNVTGNIRTKTDFILNEFNEVLTGETIEDAIMIVNRGVMRLRDYGIFRSVKCLLLPSKESSDKLDLKINVKERGRIGLRIATMTERGKNELQLSGQIRNIFGRAELLEVSTALGWKLTRFFDISFTKPSLFRLFSHRDSLNLRTSVYSKTLDRTTFSFRSNGFQLCLNTHNGHNFEAENSFRQIQPLNDSSIKVKDSARSPSSKLAFRYLWTKSQLDHPIVPTCGYSFRFGSEIATRDSQYIRNTIDGRWYLPFGPKKNFSFGLALRTDMIYPIVIPIRLEDRLISGPLLLRGFEPDTIGPRDGLGGDCFTAASLSIMSPSITNIGARVHMFLNTGNLGNLFSSTKSKTNTFWKQGLYLPNSSLVHSFFTSFRVSLGTGVVIPIGGGRLEANIAFPFRSFSSDKTSLFSLLFDIDFL